MSTKSPFSVKISAETRSQIEALAKLWGESMSQVVVRSVEREYAKAFPGASDEVARSHTPMTADAPPPQKIVPALPRPALGSLAKAMEAIANLPKREKVFKR